MPFASFNQAHEKHTNKTDEGPCQRTHSVRYQVPGLEVASEMRLTELDGIPAEKRQRCCTEKRHQIRNDNPMMDRIVETHEEKEAQGRVGQEMRSLVLPQDVLGNEDVLGKRQVNDCAQADETEYETDDPHCL